MSGSIITMLDVHSYFLSIEAEKKIIRVGLYLSTLGYHKVLAISKILVSLVY